MTKRTTTPEIREKIRNLRKKGWLLDDIAIEVDFSLTTVSNHTRDILPPHGGKWTRPGRPRSIDYDKVLKLRKQGLSYAELCERFRVSRITIYRAIRIAQGLKDVRTPVRNRKRIGGDGRRRVGRKRQELRKFVEAARRRRRVHDAGPQVGPN